MEITTIYLTAGASAVAVFGCSYCVYTLNRCLGQFRRPRLQRWYYRELVRHGYDKKSRVQSAVRLRLVNRW